MAKKTTSVTLEPVMLNDVRASFLNIFKKGSFKGEENNKYDGTVIFDKPEHKKYVEGLKKQINKLCNDVFDAKDPEDADVENKYLCLKNDNTRTKKGNREEYQGFHTLKAGNKDRPFALDTDKSPLSAEDGVLYSGCRVNVKITLYAFESDYGPVIGCNLIAIQFAGDDEKLGGAGMSLESAMEGFEEIKDADPFA